jgi:hypothetical protein
VRSGGCWPKLAMLPTATIGKFRTTKQYRLVVIAVRVYLTSNGRVRTRPGAHRVPSALITASAAPGEGCTGGESPTTDWRSSAIRLVLSAHGLGKRGSSREAAALVSDDNAIMLIQTGRTPHLRGSDALPEPC